MTREEAILRATALLGIRAKELLPPHASLRERSLVTRQARRTWSVIFDIPFPEGVVISPGEVIVEVDDETGEASEFVFM